MFSRGQHVGSVKASAAVASLESWAADTPHELSYIKILHDPAHEKRGQLNQQCLACSRCRRKGNPAMFKKTPCSSETKPIHTKLATWIRRLVAINKANGPALKTGLLLTQTELDEMRLDSNGQLSASAQVPLNQGKFAATVEAARLAGHEIVQVLPHGVMRRPGSKAKRVPPVYVTCKKCWKVNPNGAVKLWGVKCQPPEERAKAAQGRYWRTLVKKQHDALAKAWGVTVAHVKAYFPKGPKRATKSARLSPWSAVRIGEASHPGPRNLRAQRLCRPQKIWSCNTGGAPKTWQLLKHIKSEQPTVALLQEVAWNVREWAAYHKAAGKAGYNAYFSGTAKDSRKGGSAVLIRKNLPSRPAWHFADNGGAAQFVWVGGYLLGSIYLAPNYESVHTSNEIVARLLALAPQDAWLIGGDFNAEPTLPLDGKVIGALISLQQTMSCQTR